ncbi:uncharacterized protein TNCV_1674181 [Trichonephila clavipes]|nr:uncharacterized protein TNCV_1674181 [Trichonephila clavipes]
MAERLLTDAFVHCPDFGSKSKFYRSRPSPHNLWETTRGPIRFSYGLFNIKQKLIKKVVVFTDKFDDDIQKKVKVNDDHREEITQFVQSTPGFQACDEDVEIWMACDAEDCGFQMLNDDEIVISEQEESEPVDDETDEDEDNNNESSKGPSNADALSALETAMEWYEQQSGNAVLLNYYRSRESETFQRKNEGVQWHSEK